MNFWWWRAYAGYRLARWLLRFAWLVRQPRAWPGFFPMCRAPGLFLGGSGWCGGCVLAFC